MYNVEAYEIFQGAAKIEQLPVKREWMDKTFDGHAYRCFPLSLTNQMGWGFSFPKDITVIWDGSDTEQGDHIKVLEGHEFVNTNRGTATLIFNIGWFFFFSLFLPFYEKKIEKKYIYKESVIYSNL
jgi:hypothetical protein